MVTCPSLISVPAAECHGAGTFYFQNEHLRGRFLCWRVVQNVVLLREFSFHTSLKHNGICVEVFAPVLPTSVFAVESWEDDAVTLHLVTHAGTVHRFRFSVPQDRTSSIFVHATPQVFLAATLASTSHCDVVQTLKSEEVVTAALWINEYNVVLGTDAGRLLGVNFGLPRDVHTMHDFVFTDASLMTWLWQGIVQKTRATLLAPEKETQHEAILALAWFPLETDHDDDDEVDVCVVTLSADCVLKAWSFGSQACLGRQDLNKSILSTAAFDRNGQTHAHEDGASRSGVYATRAKVVALSPTDSANCRLMVHFDTTLACASEIYLLRGDLPSTVALGTGDELALDVARIFTVHGAASPAPRGLKLVDFVVTPSYLFSSWRALHGDATFVHPNPMASTGPKRIVGQALDTLDVQMQEYEQGDNEWTVASFPEEDVTRLDAFFMDRLFVPGRFSRQNLLHAIKASRCQDEELSWPIGFCDAKYKERLVQLVATQCHKVMEKQKVAHYVARREIWQELLASCMQHWRWENVPIGFVPATTTLLPGTPLMVRRNGVSLVFPAAPLITATFSAQVEALDASDECVVDIHRDVLPIFDAFPSQPLQTFMHRKVADVASEWQVDSSVALARHCIRLGLNPNRGTDDGTLAPDVVLTRAVFRLSILLGSTATFHTQVLHKLVTQLFPFQLLQKHHPLSLHTQVNADDDRASDQDDRNDLDASSTYTDRASFAGFEMCRAFAQVATRTIEAMGLQSLRVVLLLAYLVDTRPPFVTGTTLSTIERVFLPQSILIYQRWRLGQRVARQGVEPPCTDKVVHSATLMPSLLATFLFDNNRTLTRSADVKRALSVLQLATNVQSDEAYEVLATFAKEIVRLIAQPTRALVHFLHKRHHFSLLRAMFSCNLSDLSVPGPTKGHQPTQMHTLTRSIGECLALEGQVAATHTQDARHARWCFQQAIRCFGICLCHFFNERTPRQLFAEKALDQFIYDVVGHLKETMPRGFYDQLLGFLWTVVTQALGHFTPDDGDMNVRMHSFLWVNVFKYAVDEHAFRDAHLALMHLVELSSASESVGAQVEGQASECVNCLVHALYRHGHLDLIGELQWGPLEAHVEKYILWQAAHATVIKTNGLDPLAMGYYHLLFTFYVRKQQPANAAAALYALALRLRLGVSTSKEALEAQRNALNAACTSLRALPAANQWVVRKLHTEELLVATSSGNKATRLSNVVTLEDMCREVAILDGKLLLLALGHSESLLLSTMDGDEVIALLIDAVYSSCHTRAKRTEAERRRAGVVSVEVATDIATRGSKATLCGLTKSLARYCVATELARVARDLLWELLEMVLLRVASLQQYEIAAETMLDFWQQKGRKLVLPLWLRKHLSNPTVGNPAKLLRLYLKHGLLNEGLQLVDRLVIESIDKIKVGIETEPQGSGHKLPALPWIPYNLVDSLLDSTAAVLNDGARGDVSNVAIAKLREQEQSLRQHLMHYLKLVNALQQAHEAAHVGNW